MKKTLILSLFLVTTAFSQTTLRLFPDIVNGTPASRAIQIGFTDIAAGATGTFEFHFPKDGRDGNKGSGFNTVVAWIDSAVSPGARDSLVVDVFALFLDNNDNRYERIALSTSEDSVRIADDLNWGTNHTDLLHSISKAINFMFCDGILVKASNSGAALKFRCEVRLGVSK